MRGTIDAAGRLVVPESLRVELGFEAGLELELTASDGHLEISVPSRVRTEVGPHGVRFAAAGAPSMDAAAVRALMESGRR